MSIVTNLANRIKHTSLPKSAGLMPLFEAVVNSIHSIEEAGVDLANGNIIVEILRNTQGSLNMGNEGAGREPLNDITGFNVTDNGIGFDDVNMESFETLDSDHKAQKGCRGVGRLMWLKAFELVHVDSRFLAGDNTLHLRTFDFNAQSGITNSKTELLPQGTTRSTTVQLDGFRDTYRDASRKTADAISRQLFEHCLWYFIRPGTAPSILIRDGEETIPLNDIYRSSLHENAVSEQISVKGVPFELTHIKLRASTSQSHQIAYCAANRLVKEETLKGKIPGLYGRIDDGDGEFIYSCYISSPLLDNSVRNERTGFDIEDEVSGLFAGSTVSLNDIREAVLARAKVQLEAVLKDGRERGMARVNQFVENEAPRYRPILSRIPEDQLYVDPSITNKELELTLHKHYAEIEQKMLADGHDILNRMDTANGESYQDEFDSYIATLSDMKMADLANYVSHRRVILNILEKALQRNENGRYAKEEILHSLIMPMRQDSSGIFPDSMNLWLIDERLAFHNYLASDKPISSLPISGSQDAKEPDLISLFVDQNPILISEEMNAPFSSLSVIEIKRPMRNDMGQGEDKDPIEQALGYLKRVREGGVTTHTGRTLGNASDIPAYCYVIADLTKTMIGRCEMHDLHRTPDGLGYFGYKKSFNSYVEVIGFDRLLNIAKQRNRAFFDKLGLPT